MRPTCLIIHHTATNRNTTTFEAVNNYHKQLWNWKSSLGYYIGYQYFITADGKLRQGRADNEPGAHCVGWNNNSVGICLTGNFEIEIPTEAQLETLKSLVDFLRNQWQIDLKNIFGHKEKRTTLCPGKNLMVWVEDYRKKSPSSREEIKKKIIELLNQL